MKVWLFLKQEIWKIFITDRRRAIFILGAPLAYLFLFSLLYNTSTINAVPVVIYDEDQTQLSYSLIQIVDDSERFKIVNYAISQDEMESALHEKEAFAAIHIPKNFAKDAKLGHSATVLLMVNGSNIIITNTITNSVQEMISGFNKETAKKLLEAKSGQMPYFASNKVGAIDFRLRVLNNPTQSYLYFFVIGLALAAFQQGVFLAVGASILSDRNSEMIKNANPFIMIITKLLPYYILALFAFFITIFFAVHLFKLPCKAPLSSLFLLSSAFTSAAVGLSAFLASICKSELTFTRISIIYTVPAFVFSGYTWPQAAMDTFSQVISYAFPLTYVSNTVRELMLAGYSPVLYQNSFILFLFGIILTIIAILCYIHSLKHVNGGGAFNSGKA